MLKMLFSKRSGKDPAHETTGEPVKVLTDAGRALAWARRISAAPGTHADVFGRDDDVRTPYSTQDYLDAWGSGVA